MAPRGEGARGGALAGAAVLAFWTAGNAQRGGDRLIAETDFFCRGVPGRSVSFEGRVYRDCAGGHGPRGGVKPDLVELLNDLQETTGRRVIVSSGYRCQEHNLYSWAAWSAESGDREGVSLRSLHRAGAAADVYLDGVGDLAVYRMAEERLHAMAAERGDSLWTKVYGPAEVRDPDNRHSFPYIHVHLKGIARRAEPPVKGRPRVNGRGRPAPGA